jgi:two-component system, OmpR family, response regulator RegX3
MAEAPLILVVDDEESYRDALSVALEREGFRVALAADGQEALDQFEATRPGLVLLDVMLPRISGVDVCRELRSRSRVPIIIVTARSAEIDAVVGLEVGADDYVSKPFRLRELIARVRAALRRSSEDEAVDTVSEEVLEVGDVRLDAGRHEVFVRGEPVALPLKEFELLELLLANAGRVLTRDVLIDRIWGPNYFGDTKTLDVHVKRLRAKVEGDPSNPTRVVTIRGVGYRYEKPRQAAALDTKWVYSAGSCPNAATASTTGRQWSRPGTWRPGTLAASSARRRVSTSSSQGSASSRARSVSSRKPPWTRSVTTLPALKRAWYAGSTVTR